MYFESETQPSHIEVSRQTCIPMVPRCAVMGPQQLFRSWPTAPHGSPPISVTEVSAPVTRWGSCWRAVPSSRWLSTACCTLERLWCRWIHLGIGSGDVVVGCLPPSDAFGMTCVLAAAISTGATLALLPRSDPRAALKTIAAERVTIFASESSMYAAMLAAAAHRDPDFGSLRICILAGPAMPMQVLRGFEDLSGCAVLEGYGMPETSGPVCFTHPALPRKAGSMGTPIDGVQVRVVDQRCNRGADRDSRRDSRARATT
jgi:acyl-CoA synthetase (AMP-forming)/AMP-acid ligase II